MKDEIEQEKQQKIVDAVNALQGELTHDNCYFYKEDKYLHRAIAGSYCTTSVVAKDMAGFICTVEEFNQCVKEMVLHKGDTYTDYRVAIYEAKDSGEDTQLQPEPKKQIEWKNGDKCIARGVKYAFVGHIPDNRCVIIDCDKLIVCLDVAEIKKPTSKEKRWIAYNSKINRAMSRGYKTKSDCYNAMAHNKFRDEYQYMEIEINV